MANVDCDKAKQIPFKSGDNVKACWFETGVWYLGDVVSYNADKRTYHISFKKSGDHIDYELSEEFVESLAVDEKNTCEGEENLFCGDTHGNLVDDMVALPTGTSTTKSAIQVTEKKTIGKEWKNHGDDEPLAKMPKLNREKKKEPKKRGKIKTTVDTTFPKDKKFPNDKYSSPRSRVVQSKKENEHKKMSKSCAIGAPDLVKGRKRKGPRTSSNLCHICRVYSTSHEQSCCPKCEKKAKHALSTLSKNQISKSLQETKHEKPHPQRFKKNQRIFAIWSGGSKNKYYSGIVASHKKLENTYTIHYDDGAVDENVKTETISLYMPQEHAVNSIVYACWFGTTGYSSDEEGAKNEKDKTWYRGKVLNYNTKACTYHVTFDDGDEDHDLSYKYVESEEDYLNWEKDDTNKLSKESSKYVSCSLSIPKSALSVSNINDDVPTSSNKQTFMNSTFCDKDEPQVGPSTFMSKVVIKPALAKYIVPPTKDTVVKPFSIPKAEINTGEKIRIIQNSDVKPNSHCMFVKIKVNNKFADGGGALKAFQALSPPILKHHNKEITASSMEHDGIKNSDSKSHSMLLKINEKTLGGRVAILDTILSSTTPILKHTPQKSAASSKEYDTSKNSGSKLYSTLVETNEKIVDGSGKKLKAARVQTTPALEHMDKKSSATSKGPGINKKSDSNPRSMLVEKNVVGEKNAAQAPKTLMLKNIKTNTGSCKEHDTSNIINNKCLYNEKNSHMQNNNNTDGEKGKHKRKNEVLNDIASSTVTSQKKKKNFSAKPQKGAAAVKQKSHPNFDYCFTCRKTGYGLICCDHCPRSFHMKCMPRETRRLTANWKCHMCIREDFVQSEDYLYGREFFDPIKAAFTRCSKTNTLGLFTEKILIVSKLHEMVNRIMTSEFGYGFRNPVSVQEYPDYLNVVPNPMYLETICFNIVNGTYAEMINRMEVRDVAYIRDQNNAPASPIDHAIFFILKDIETVWQNCFKYNPLNSKLYRMAQILRKKCQKIVSINFRGEISVSILERLDKMSNEYEKMPSTNFIAVNENTSNIAKTIRHPSSNQNVCNDVSFSRIDSGNGNILRANSFCRRENEKVIVNPITKIEDGSNCTLLPTWLSPKDRNRGRIRGNQLGENMVARMHHDTLVSSQNASANKDAIGHNEEVEPRQSIKPVHPLKTHIELDSHKKLPATSMIQVAVNPKDVFLCSNNKSTTQNLYNESHKGNQIVYDLVRSYMLIPLSFRRKLIVAKKIVASIQGYNPPGRFWGLNESGSNSASGLLLWEPLSVEQSTFRVVDLLTQECGGESCPPGTKNGANNWNGVNVFRNDGTPEFRTNNIISARKKMSGGNIKSLDGPVCMTPMMIESIAFPNENNALNRFLSEVMT
mmetsp:Transcript_33452/g.40525  ORF Transcript_33452/g.40525 Transcript_33452/m.40525 type:complete len:1369 (+) Transcript_33452:183-4289(+)